METHRPIVVLTLDRTVERLPLGMTLNAHVVRLHIVQTGWIHDVGARRPFDVLAARAVTPFAAHVPFGDGLGLDIVIDRVASVA